MGCGLKLYVNDEGRLVKVEGDENHPVTQGRLCPRCIALKDYVYNPARILVPLKRDRADRGKADAWEECSWDEAFGIVKENYERICAEYGPESIIGMSGTDVYKRQLQGDLWRRVHPAHGRHWPRGRPHAAGIRSFGARHAERMLHAIGRCV